MASASVCVRLFGASLISLHKYSKCLDLKRHVHVPSFRWMRLMCKSGLKGAKGHKCEHRICLDLREKQGNQMKRCTSSCGSVKKRYLYYIYIYFFPLYSWSAALLWDTSLEDGPGFFSFTLFRTFLKETTQAIQTVFSFSCSVSRYGVCMW